VPGFLLRESAGRSSSRSVCTASAVQCCGLMGRSRSLWGVAVAAAAATTERFIRRSRPACAAAVACTGRSRLHCSKGLPAKLGRHGRVTFYGMVAAKSSRSSSHPVAAAGGFVKPSRPACTAAIASWATAVCQQQHRLPSQLVSYTSRPGCCHSFEACSGSCSSSSR
jgi:hypothetical protein